MRKNKIGGMVTALVLAAVMLTGCGSTAGNSNASQSAQAVTSAATQTTESSAAATTESAIAETAATQEKATEAAAETQTGDTTAESGKTLVVYYSASGTTKRVATAIADATGADLYEITPVEPYTSDDLNWTNSSSRVSREHDDESLRDIALTEITPADWDSYDTVLIGYPIWWNLAPRIIDTFIETHHLAGKTLIPFATSGGSGITNSVGALKKAYPDLNWKEGELLNRMDENGIREWIGKTSKD